MIYVCYPYHSCRVNIPYAWMVWVKVFCLCFFSGYFCVCSCLFDDLTATPRSQIGNPEGEEKPNKKYYDPRACIRSAEESTVKRVLGRFFLFTFLLPEVEHGSPENKPGPKRKVVSQPPSFRCLLVSGGVIVWLG